MGAVEQNARSYGKKEPLRVARVSALLAGADLKEIVL
jgi:hypothetical protein